MPCRGVRNVFSESLEMFRSLQNLNQVWEWLYGGVAESSRWGQGFVQSQVDPFFSEGTNLKREDLPLRSRVETRWIPS